MPVPYGYAAPAPAPAPAPQQRINQGTSVAPVPKWAPPKPPPNQGMNRTNDPFYLPPGMDTSHRQGGAPFAAGNPALSKNQFGEYGRDPYYQYDPSGRRAFGGPGARDSMHGGSAYNYQDSLTPEQRARMDQVYDRARLNTLALQQRGASEAYALGYRNWDQGRWRNPQGQTMPIPGGQGYTYNGRTGTILGDSPYAGQNRYEMYPQMIRPRPNQFRGDYRDGGLAVAQGFWDRTYGMGDLSSPDPNQWNMSRPGQQWWESDPFHTSYTGGYIPPYGYGGS